MLIIEENTLTHVDSVSDIIEHYGKKGMKWGVRNQQKRIDKIKKRSTKLKSKNGDTLYLEKRTALSQKLFGNGQAYQRYTRLYNSKGERVGAMGYRVGGVFNKYGKVDWNGIDEKYRGRGYSQAAFKEVEKRISNTKGVKEIRLDSVRSKDARHIYDKNGYVEDTRKKMSNRAMKKLGLEPMVKKLK